MLANFAEMVMRAEGLAEAQAQEQLMVHADADVDVGKRDQESLELIKIIDGTPDSCMLCDPHMPGWCVHTV